MQITTSNEVTTKRVYDEEGGFRGLLLCQGGNEIFISFAKVELDSQYHSYKWDNLKKVIEKHKEEII